MLSPSRKVIFDLLCAIEFRGAFSDNAIHSEPVGQLETRDRHFVTEVVYGTLRWRGWLDFVTAGACSRPWKSIDAKVKLILRMSLYQMAKMDRVPGYALINDAVELAKDRVRPESGGFVNGVLRHLGRRRPWLADGFEQQLQPWTRASLPEWLWERWEGRYGRARAMQYGLSLNDQPQRAFWIPEPAGDTDTAESPTEIRASEIVPGAFLCDGLVSRLLPSGLPAWIQDESSQLIPHLLGVISGWRVWDACAAPGGKSAILMKKCGTEGRLVSSDRWFGRALQLRKNLHEAGMTEAFVLMLDASRPAPFRVEYDAVLADVPCSGLGTLRRNPEIKWRFRPRDLGVLQKAQLEILASVAENVRIGGWLLYCTCSTEPEENEEVIEGFLHSHPEFALKRPSSPPGIERWLDRRGLFRSFPEERLWDGLFAALMLRNS